MNKDLTVGKADQVFWRFCLPLFGSIVFQQLYNIADSLVAGKLVGETALAAVGNSYEITLILIAFSFGCNMGCSVLVSQLFGAKRYGELKSAVSTACIFSGILCLCLMAFTFFGGEMLLRFIKTPEDIFADSTIYLDIYVYGLPFVFFYNIATGIFSGLGDSRTPFLFLAASSVSNIFMDIVFVLWFLHMGISGVAGVAWATFLCQGVSCILAMTVVFRRLSKIGNGIHAPLFDRNLLKKFLIIAVPSICQQSFISVGNIVIQGVINGFGTAVIAGYAAAVKLNNLVITAFTTLANGISNYTAQNIGAGKYERVKEGMRAGIKIVWILSLPLFLLYFFAGEYAIRFFMNEPTAEAVHTGVTYLRILSPFYFVISVKLVLDGILRGASMMKSFMAATFTDLLLRVVLAAVFSRTVLGSAGIWCAWPVGWCVATAMSGMFYRKGVWHQEDGKKSKIRKIAKK